MERHEVVELCYITPIANVSSILALGLLSHNRAAGIHHDSIAEPRVQDIRASKRVPNGLRLHDYVNLYFNARNPMMYARRERHAECCILQVDPSVLDLPGTVIADRNASRFAAFRPAPGGLAIVDKTLTFARWWTHEDPIEQDRRKALQCAEVLVPHGVPPRYIAGAYVSCPDAQRAMRASGCPLPLRLAPRRFFR
jgi:ssDNA thymidine ADP-ribosyltransferase, DarT